MIAWLLPQGHSAVAGSDFAGRPYLHSMDVITEGSKDIVFTTYTPAWKLHRKIAMQAVRHYMRGPLLEKVVHHAVAMVADKMAAEPGAFDPHLYNTLLMFHIIDTICFGKNKPFDDPEIANLMYIFDTFNAEAGNGFLEDVIPLLKYWPTKKFRRAIGFTGDLLKYLYKNIDEHRESFDPDHIRDLTDSILLAQSEAEREERPEVMAMFTDTHVGETISDIFGAGVDTSRMTLDWAVLYMAGHPEVKHNVNLNEERL